MITKEVIKDNANHQNVEPRSQMNLTLGTPGFQALISILTRYFVRNYLPKNWTEDLQDRTLVTYYTYKLIMFHTETSPIL